MKVSTEILTKVEKKATVSIGDLNKALGYDIRTKTASELQQWLVSGKGGVAGFLQRFRLA